MFISKMVARYFNSGLILEIVNLVSLLILKNGLVTLIQYINYEIM